MKSRKKDLAPILKELLRTHASKTQEEISHALSKLGYKVNQVKVSRLLKKIGAVKIKNEFGQIVYWLPKEPPPANLSDPISSLITSIDANESMIVIHTTPGAASVVARMVDYLNEEIGVLGSIAGDDTVFIAPKSVVRIKLISEKIKTQLGFN